jgi:hypothetical protein
VPRPFYSSARTSLLVPALLVLALLPAGPAAAWTPKTQLAIAREAARLAPPDLARQIDRHRREFEAGVLAPFEDGDPARHMKNEDGSGTLDRVLADEVAAAIADIRGHRPFADVVRRLGAVSHYLADANNPLATSAADTEEGRYFIDYLQYAETAEPRFPLLFYGIRPGLEARRDVSSVLAETLGRGRELYPMIGREYRRIGYASGRGRFDDRSSAFGVTSIAFSRAVSDVVVVLRYVWIKAGGGDDRSRLPAGGTRLLLLPRTPKAH